MSTHIQSISRNYYENRTEINFNKYYQILRPIVYSISIKILRNHHDADDNVSLVFTKLYNSATFIFDDTKSHLSYVYTVALNSARLLYKKRSKDKLVCESELLSPDSEETRDNILDYIYTNSTTPDSEPLDIDAAYLHNSPKHQFEKTIEIIGNLDKNNQNGGTAQIIMDALCNDIVSSSLRKIESMVDEETRSIILLLNEQLRKEISHKGKRINTIVTETGIEKDIIKSVIGIRDIIMKEIGHYGKIAKQHGLTIPDSVMTYEQIAEKHGLNTVGAVKTKVFRAKKHIRKELVSQIKLMERADGKIITGLEKGYFEKSKVLKHEINFLDGQYHGKFIKYHKNGNKKLEASYEFGILHGKYAEYYNNGVAKITCEYVDGKIAGKLVGRNADNTIDSEYEYCGDAIFFDHFDNQGVIEEHGIL